MSQEQQIVNLLAHSLPQVRSAALVKHHAEMSCEFRKSHWESATVKAGKFVEATLKCLGEHCGVTIPPDKQFKVEGIITQLGQLPASIAVDSVRLTIPRACRFVYEVASNRGARHDSSEMDPNVMDANGVYSVCSWILAELIRYSQKGKLSAPAATELVSKLTEKRYPLFEEIDGRLYFSDSEVGARKLTLLLLSYRYPNRMERQELIDTLLRHGESAANARMAITRLKGVIDDSGNGEYKLRAPGLEEAEHLLAERMSRVSE